MHICVFEVRIKLKLIKFIFKFISDAVLIYIMGHSQLGNAVFPKKNRLTL